MALPRHLQGRFNAADGTPLPSDPNAPPAADPPPPAEAAPPPDPADAEADPPNAEEPDGSAHDGADVPPPDANAGAGAEVAAPPDSDGSAEGKKDPVYARMEGRYKAQIRRLEEQIGELKEQARSATTLTDLLARTREELAVARTPAAPTATTPAAPDPNELTAEEVALFGDFAPVAQKLIARATAPLQREIAELRTQTGAVDERVGQTSEAMFVGHVRARVPTFDTIRNDPAWAEFLQRPVPYTAHTMGSALADAHEARDLDRVLSIFDAFAGQAGRAATPPSTPPAATPSAHAANGTTPPGTPPAGNGLGQFATPERSAANPPAAPKPQFRAGDYRARMDDMRAGRLSKQDFLQFEQDFDAARRAGRVAST